MSSLVAACLVGLVPSLAQEAQEFQPGPKRVQTRASRYYASLKSPKKKIGTAKYGDKVIALALEGRYVRVRRADGTEAYIFKNALVAPDAFNPAPENEREKSELQAQNYKAGRFDKDTEQEYINQKGPKMRGAYQQLDALMSRGERRTSTEDADLAKFRLDGKLGEHSPVK